MKIQLNERQRAALSMYFTDEPRRGDDIGASDDFDIEVADDHLIVNGARLDDDGEWSLAEARHV